jgi:hypothetical protein
VAQFLVPYKTNTAHEKCILCSQKEEGNKFIRDINAIGRRLGELDDYVKKVCKQ